MFLSFLTVLEMSPAAFSDSSRKISTEADAGLGPLNSGGGVPFLVVSAFHSAAWVIDHSFGLKGNSIVSILAIAAPGLGSRIVSDALMTFSRVPVMPSSPAHRRCRLDEAVVGELQRLHGDLGLLDVERRAGPADGHDAVEAPRHHRLVVRAERRDVGGGPLDGDRHARQPLGDPVAVRPDRPAELDVRVLEPPGELVDELVVATLLAGLD